MSRSDRLQGLPASVARLLTPDLAESLVTLRRDLHRRPELSGSEHETAARLRRELERLDVAPVEAVAATGLLLRIPGREPGAPGAVIRGDIDALPIDERTGLEFASTCPGNMHACGHDLHAAWTVGAAALLAQAPADGDVLILLQPAEETCEGAMAVLESGALVGFPCMFGAHVDTRFEVGCVLIEAGAIMASADTFRIELAGKGGHGGRPHEARDPIVGCAALISALQTLVAREIDPARAAVVSVTRVSAGRAANVIPDEAILEGTLRALAPETRRHLHDGLRRVAEGIARAHGLTCEVVFELGPPPLLNALEDAELARRAAAQVVGPDCVLAGAEPLMAGEDFAYYLEQRSGCYLRIGARSPGGQPTSTHSPDFMADERALFVGAAVLAACARQAAASRR